MSGCVYLVRERATDKVVYVGQTSMTLKKRWSCHLLDKKPYADRVFQARGGAKAFSCEEVFRSTVQKELDRVERELIVTFRTLKPEGLNIESGGKTQYITDAIKKKMREASPFKKKVFAIVISTGVREEYESAKEASRQLKCDCSAISAASRGSRATYYKRYWSYLCFEIKNGDGEKTKAKQVKAVKNTDEVYLFNSTCAASKFTGVNTGNIRNICVGRGRTSNGWSFSYV